MRAYALDLRERVVAVAQRLASSAHCGLARTMLRRYSFRAPQTDKKAPIKASRVQAMLGGTRSRSLFEKFIDFSQVSRIVSS